MKLCIAEPVKVHLIKSYCLPLITYCIVALELNSRAISELAVFWSVAIRKIFHFNRLSNCNIFVKALTCQI